MIIIYWKWRVWNALFSYAKYFHKEVVLMDDNDYDDNKLLDSELIVVSPWIPPFHKLYTNYKSKIQWELDFVFSSINDELKSNISIIAVTWTDWKSTVCWMVYSLLKIINQKYNLWNFIWLWGNFDIPFCEICEQIMKNNFENKKHFICLEVSSFMWYNIKNISFDFSIWTNFQTDHLNWHNDMDDYFLSKSKIINNTKYLSYTSIDIINRLDTSNRVYPYEKVDLKWTKFQWEHNSYNLWASLLAVRWLLSNKWYEFSMDELLTLSKEINPLDHRIQLVREVNWIKIYDDGKSTSANSLNAALNSFEEKVILISWWSDKWDKFNHLSSSFVNKVAGAVFIGQTSTTFKEIFDQLQIESKILPNMDSAVIAAFKMAQDMWVKVLLFSPWCASFDMFKNRLDRVQQFLLVVEKL